MSYEAQSPQSALLFSEALVPEVLAEKLLHESLEITGGVYNESFEDRGRFIDDVGKITEALKVDPVTGPALHNLRNGVTVILKLSGLPRDPELPEAPIDGGTPHGKKSFVSEGIAIAMANAIGYPGIILGEKKEALVHQITPVPGRETSQSNEGSTELLFHQDLAPNRELPHISYHEAMPTWLILSGLQSGSGNTPTYIATLDEALDHMTQEAIDVLSQERFVTNPPDSFIKETPELADKPPVHPILLNHNGKIEASYDTSSNVRPIAGADDKEAIKAISELNLAISAVKRAVVIEPGTAVIFNNRRVVHGRGAIVQEEKLGQKRWLQRVYVFEPERLALQAMGRIGTRIQIGGGILRLTDAQRPPSARLLELAN